MLVVPQWFGSGSPDAHRIAAGGRMLAECLDVPEENIVDLPEAVDGGEAWVDVIRRYPAMAEAARLVRQRLTELEGAPILVGGECGLEWGALGGRDTARTAVLWLDAHPDFHTPESSPSGSFHGMVLRRLVDAGDVPAGNVVPAGTRSVDAAERTALAEYGIAPVPVDRIDTVVSELERRDPADVWIHVDLDVLDPREFVSLGCSEPDGLPVKRLIDTIEAVTTRWPLAGAAVVEFSPIESADRDLATVLRIVDALRRGSRGPGRP